MINNICEVLENVSLENYNTYKIKSSAKYMAFPKNNGELIELIKYLKENNIKYFLLGNGSNVILPDEEYDGVIISFKKMCNYEYLDNYRVFVQAGVMLNKISMETVNNNMSGLEWATGIPGTVGASILGNAGAYLREIKEFIESVDVLDDNLNIITLKLNDMDFDYRTSSFKKDRKYIILSAILQLKEGNKDNSMELVQDRLQRRINSQPLEYPSAGSVFRNPSKELPAGKLIEDAGLKGTKIGGAKISEKHANFIVNEGNAKASDVKELIKLIKDTIKKENDIDLICEQEIIEWD